MLFFWEGKDNFLKHTIKGFINDSMELDKVTNCEHDFVGLLSSKIKSNKRQLLIPSF